jgi:hypothetical protein
MKDEYPTGKSDLFAAFIERCTELAVPRGGAAGMITMQSWMFLSSYEKLRASLLAHQQISSMLHLGARAFDSIGGEVVSSTAFVLENLPHRLVNSGSKQTGIFVRLVDGTSEAEKISALRGALAQRTRDANFYLASGDDFAAVPGSPIVYWLSEKMRAAFVRPEDALAPVAFREGLSSSSNDRFVREWFEVSTGMINFRAVSRSDAQESQKSWFPFDSGGSFRRWWGNHEVVINWRNDGEEIIAERPRSTVRNPDKYFQEHLTISKISSGASSFRLFPAGFVIASVSKCAFVDSLELRWVSGVLNSNVTHAILAAKSPTLSFLASDMESIPLRRGKVDLLAERVERLTECSRTDWDSSETSWNFSGNLLVALSKSQKQ